MVSKSGIAVVEEKEEIRELEDMGEGTPHDPLFVGGEWGIE